MARNHIEFVQDGELDWQESDLAAQSPPIRFKTLSIDDETGAFTRLVELSKGWESAKLTAPTTQEFFLLEGKLEIEEHVLDEYGYLRLPGETRGSIVARKPCRFLWMVDSGLEGPINNDKRRFWKGDENEITYVDTSKLEWQRADLPGPEPGLFLKQLYQDEESGATTTFVKADWNDPRQKHHDCAEEVYAISGEIQLGERGVIKGGDYIWRPPWIRHGGPEKVVSAPFVALIRCDGPQAYHYMSAEGAPLNY